MRNMRFLLAAAVLGFGVDEVGDALADRNTKDGPATVRLASNTARRWKPVTRASRIV